MTSVAIDMDHRATSILFLKSTDLIPVEIRGGEKAAGVTWDPRRAIHEDKAALIERLAADKGLNLAALFFGRYADIDVDSYATHLQAALDAFLPRTAYVWGRPGKPRSHRAYALNEDFDRSPHSKILKFCKDLKFGDESYSVELRGGKPESGFYSVLPGSIHLSGEAYEWAEDIDPTVSGSYVTVETLTHAIRMAQAVAMLAPYWVEGLRNDLSLALSGLLWRIRAASFAAYGIQEESEFEGPDLLLTEELSRRFLEIVLMVSGDDEADRRSRLLNFKNTWEKLDRDPLAKVTGGGMLAEQLGEYGQQKVRALYRLLSDSDDLEQIEAVANQFVIWYGPGVCVDLDMVMKGRDQPWMTKEQARGSLGGRKVTIGDKKIPIVDLIFGSTIIRRVAGVTFDPSTTEVIIESPQGVVVNQWRGFFIEPHAQMVLDEEIKPFLDYVSEVLADGDEQRTAWILSWLADMFQRPSEKPGTALVLVGVHGAGKTFLGEEVIGPIVGERHYVKLDDIQNLTDRFNNISANRIFIQCDEAMHGYQKNSAARLKSIITDRTITVEPKNINSFKAPSHAHFLFTSNDDSTAVFIDPSPFERRYTVLRVSDKRAKDLEYWTGMRAWIVDARPRIHRWLLDHEYDRDLILRPLMTDAKRDIQRIGVDIEVSWVATRIKQGFPLAEKSHGRWFHAFHTNEITEDDMKNNTLRRDMWPNRVVGKAVEEDFIAFARAQGRTVWTGSAITSLKKALPPGALEDAGETTAKYFTATGKVVEKVRTLHFPPPSDIMKFLRERYGDIVDGQLSVLPDPSMLLVVDQEEVEF